MKFKQSRFTASFIHIKSTSVAYKNNQVTDNLNEFLYQTAGQRGQEQNFQSKFMPDWYLPDIPIHQCSYTKNTNTGIHIHVLSWTDLYRGITRHQLGMVIKNIGQGDNYQWMHTNAEQNKYSAII